MPSRFDVIVVGVGSMGSAACYYLAKRGYRVLGLEQFGIVHERGSHFGQSRIIRKAYFEHPDYVPLLERAYANWRELELDMGDKLYHETGIVYFGRPDCATVLGVQQSSRQYEIPVKQEVASKAFPAFVVPDTFTTLFEPQAGFITPERAIQSFAQGATRYGAVIRTQEKVVDWKDSASGVIVRTEQHRFEADKLIITSGAWTSKLIPELSRSLQVTRQVLVWLNPGDPTRFSFENFPCWFVDDDEMGMFYGFPILPFERFGGPIGLKLASHRRGEVTEPDAARVDVSESEIKKVIDFVMKYMPEAGHEVITAKSCLYTYSPDEHFIIDSLPRYEGRVVTACGFSGHGFKFVSVVGEILADHVEKGRTMLPIDFLNMGRLG